ncbi:hypothetical protein EON68_03910, partial [archaeon]
SGRKGAPRWVRPPPPTHRINNVIRPSSTFGDGPMLGPLLECDRNRKCLVLDLDETLVHSSFRPVPNADYILPVEIDGIVHHVYVIKRPGCDAFLQRMGECYEVVIFTASLAKVRRPHHHHHTRTRAHAPAGLVRVRINHVTAVVCVHARARFGRAVRGPAAGHAGPVQCDPRAPLPRGVRASRERVREGLVAAGPRPHGRHHRGQLARVVPLPT